MKTKEKFLKFILKWEISIVSFVKNYVSGNYYFLIAVIEKQFRRHLNSNFKRGRNTCGSKRE